MSGNPIFRTIAVGACAALLVAALAGPALAADKAACKKGGWKTLVTADGQSFRNQGQCMANVRRSKLVFAIAYSDLDGDHTFSAGDVLINKLVDTNRDGVPSAGDTIFLDQYPTSFTPTWPADFADWGVDSLVVTDVDLPMYGEIAVSTANWGNRHEWHGHPASSAEYYSESAGVGVFTSIHDRFSDAIPADRIYTNPLTPSHPGTLAQDRTAASDDRFIDVYIYGL